MRPVSGHVLTDVNLQGYFGKSEVNDLWVNDLPALVDINDRNDSADDSSAGDTDI